MHLVFRVLNEKIEQEVSDNFEVCVLNLQVGLRKIKVKKMKKVPVLVRKSFSNYQILFWKVYLATSDPNVAAKINPFIHTKFGNSFDTPSCMFFLVTILQYHSNHSILHIYIYI